MRTKRNWKASRFRNLVIKEARTKLTKKEHAELEKLSIKLASPELEKTRQRIRHINNMIQAAKGLKKGNHDHKRRRTAVKPKRSKG